MASALPFVDELHEALGGDPARLETLGATGTGDLPSAYRVTDLAVASIGVAAVAAAEVVGLAGGVVPAEAIFYSYAYPEPLHFREADISATARFDPDLGEYVLPYATVRAAADPAATLMEFLDATYDIAADLGHWDRAALERDPVAP